MVRGSSLRCFFSHTGLLLEGGVGCEGVLMVHLTEYTM